MLRGYCRRVIRGLIDRELGMQVVLDDNLLLHFIKQID
jgi:hypothetical protein